MRATMMYGAGDVRVERVPDARLIEPTDALVTVRSGCICGSDLWPYNLMEPAETGRPMGHEAIGVVEAVGADVRTVKTGDFVVMPFAYSDGTCVFCHEGLHTSRIHGGFFGTAEFLGAQAEAVRVPLADGTLFALPTGAADAMMASLPTLSVYDQIKEQALKLAPDEAKVIEDAIAAARVDVKKGDFEAAIEGTKDLPAKAKELNDRLPAKAAELKTAWASLNAVLPGAVATLNKRVGAAKSAAAKAELADLNTMWAEAQSAVQGGGLADAVTQAGEVKAGVVQLMTELKISVPKGLK
jgi:hypothetical protein